MNLKVGWFVLVLGLMVTGACSQDVDEFERMRKTFGEMTTLAGMGKSEKQLNGWRPEFEGKPATSAELSNPHITMGDDAGNYYIADKRSHRILKVDPDGMITTHAGTGESGFNGERGPARDIQLSFANGLYVLPNGTVYILDNFNDRIRKVDPDGNLTTVLKDEEGFHHGRGLWVSQDEKLIYYCGTDRSNPNSRLRKWTAEGGSETVIGGFYDLAYFTVDPKGNILVTEQGAGRVFRISPDGKKKEHLAGNGTEDEPVSGRPAKEIGLHEVRCIALRKDGSYFLCTHKGGDIVFVDTKGIAHVFIEGQGRGNVHEGDGQSVNVPGEKISEPRAVTLAPNGDLLITCNDNGFVRLVKKKR